MPNWESLTLDALRDLGADTEMVPGAKLRQRMVEMGLQRSMDVADHVERSGISFSKLAAQVDGVTVQPRPGSDVLIGLRSARVPDDAPRLDLSKPRHGALRRDVYEAFTRIASTRYVYLPGSDKFVPAERAEGKSIEIESPTLTSLIDIRRQFASTLPQDAQRPLLDALIHSANPLSQFRSALVASDLFDQWSTVYAEAIKARVIEWARQNHLTPRDAWFRHPRPATSPRRTLTLLAQYLTAEEIRELRIPFRAIEALLSDLHDK